MGLEASEEYFGVGRFSGLELIEQYKDGYALYDSPEDVQRFNALPSIPSLRVNGGITAIVNALVEKLKVSPILNTQVLSLTGMLPGE